MFQRYWYLGRNVCGTDRVLPVELAVTICFC